MPEDRSDDSCITHTATDAFYKRKQGLKSTEIASKIKPFPVLRNDFKNDRCHEGLRKSGVKAMFSPATYYEYFNIKK